MDDRSWNTPDYDKLFLILIVPGTVMQEERDLFGPIILLFVLLNSFQ